MPGKGNDHDRLAGAGGDRPRGMGPRSGGGLPRPAGDRLLPGGCPRAGSLAGRCVVARSCPVRPGAGAAARSTGSIAGLTRSLAKERAELTARQGELQRTAIATGVGIKVYAGTFTEPGPTHLLVRGDPTRKGVEVGPATVAAIRPGLTMDAALARGTEAACPGTVDC